MSSSASALIDAVVRDERPIEVDVSTWHALILEHVVKLAGQRGLKTTVTKGHEVKYDGEFIVPKDCVWLRLEIHKTKCGLCQIEGRAIDMIKTDDVEEKWTKIEDVECQLPDEPVYVCRGCSSM